MVYFDANASEAPRPEALAKAFEAASSLGNPSSAHHAGRQAKRTLSKAREAVAAFFKTAPENCIFTSGATEANALRLHAFLKNAASQDPFFDPQKALFIGASEHPSLLSTAPEGAEIIPISSKGFHDLAWLEEKLSVLPHAQKKLLCVMAANNETGLYSNLEAVYALAEKYQAWLHVDGTQAFGRGWKIPDFLANKASFALSGHKMGGMAGAGALILPEDHLFSPLFRGGGQEFGKRGGTPALPAIAAMVEAFIQAQAQPWEEIEKLRDTLEMQAAEWGADIIGKEEKRLPNTSALILENIASQAQLMAMDMAGICVSGGSACASGKMAASPVLEKMGLKAAAGCVMRVSLPWNCTEKEVAAFLKAYRPLAERARAKKQTAPEREKA